MAVLELLLSRNMRSDTGQTTGQMALDKVTVTFGAAQPWRTSAQGSGTGATAGRLPQLSLTISMSLFWRSSGALRENQSKVIIKIYCSGTSFQ